MRSLNVAACVAAMSIGLGLSAASAADDQVASMSTCMGLAGQVRTALASNGSSASYEDAVKEQRYGLEFCSNGFYAKGVDHYSHALQLLGGAQKS